MLNKIFDKYFVVDTNILLEDYTNLAKLSEENKNLIILPEIVLDEIDSKKSGFDEINYQARSFARFLEDSKIIDSKEIDNYKIIIVETGGLMIHIISKEHYATDTKQVSPNIANDRKILEIADFANNYYSKNIEFISNDIMARVRATSLNLKTNFLKGDGKDEDELDFIKNNEIEFNDLETIENKEIALIDKEFEIHNFSYCLKVKNSDQVLLASIKNKKIHILNEIELRDQIVVPLNKEQLFFTNALLDEYYNIVIVEAKAGSGKTLLALSSAVKLIRKKQFQKIIYIRNSIESLDKGEDVGYLPGLEEKFRIYNHPLMDSLRYMARCEHKNKNTNKKLYTPPTDEEVNEKVQRTIENYNIETMWVGEMRGRTLSESFVIVDEAQNMSNKTMQMVLSRIDSSCKVVVLGSNKQIDNFYVNKYTNSLTTLLKSTKKENEYVNLYAIKLKKVLRGPITQWAESIF
ncbi:MAG: PhoH family protein [Arcobacteraceae bacterium]|nr:PhoH family protein [Arcobacteraceae bacterium]